MSVWVEAARPRTLVAGAVPVLVGTASAGRFIAWRFGAALVVGLTIQVAVNYANDLFDARRGVDTADRLGPRRATAAGLVTPVQMRKAMVVAFAAAAAAGLSLAAAVGWELLVVGVLCFLAALGYSGGPKPYGSAALGEVFVFVFFGLVATIGSAYVQDERVTTIAALAAVPVGLLATAILVVNNLRDIDTDRRSGKTTLSVRIGAAATRRLYTALVLCAFAMLPVIAFADARVRPWILAPVVLLPVALAAIRTVHAAADAARLIDALSQTALLQVLFGASLAIVLWWT